MHRQNNYQHSRTSFGQKQAPYNQVTPETPYQGAAALESAFHDQLSLTHSQQRKVERLLAKVANNDIMTIKSEENVAVYFTAVKRHFESPTSSNCVRLEGLGSAVNNVVAVANSLSLSGVATMKKIKSKEHMIPYELENGRTHDRPTPHIKFDLVKAPHFESGLTRAPTTTTTQGCHDYRKRGDWHKDYQGEQPQQQQRLAAPPKMSKRQYNPSSATEDWPQQHPQQPQPWLKKGHMKTYNAKALAEKDLNRKLNSNGVYTPKRRYNEIAVPVASTAGGGTTNHPLVRKVSMADSSCCMSTKATTDTSSAMLSQQPETSLTYNSTSNNLFTDEQSLSTVMRKPEIDRLCDASQSHLGEEGLVTSSSSSSITISAAATAKNNCSSGSKKTNAVSTSRLDAFFARKPTIANSDDADAIVEPETTTFNSCQEIAKPAVVSSCRQYEDVFL